MIKGIGIDIVEIDRIKTLLEKGDRFARKILSGEELILFHNFKHQARRIEFLAGRFAAKEAFSKALGTGIGKIGFKDIEVLKSDTGAPFVRCEKIKEEKIFISISHAEHYAIAQVILEAKN